MWNGSISNVQNFALGGGRNITYPLGTMASSVGATYGLDRHSFVIMDGDGIIQYISPQSTHYTRRYTQHEAEMIAKINELLAVTSVMNSGNEIPQSFKLSQNTPNPFRHSTTIQLDVLPGAGDESTSLVIYDILGRQVITLFSGKLTGGNHRFSWNGLDGRGNRVAKGVYFYVATSQSFRETKRLIYLSK